MPFDVESFLFFLFICIFPSTVVYRSLRLFSSQELCKDLHREIATVDDERRDIEVKVARNEREVLVFVMEMN